MADTERFLQPAGETNDFDTRSKAEMQPAKR